MREIDDIWADMQALMDTASAEGRRLTDEELERYQALEAELATVQKDDAARARHRAYNTVVIPAGVPSPTNRPGETEDDGFNAYLRTGHPNADLRPSNAQSTGTGSSGGYMIPDGFLNRIVEVIKTFGGVKNNVETITTETGNPLPFPTNDDTANEATITAESATPASGADVAVGQVQLGAFEFTASGAGGDPVKVPVALIQDSAIDFETFLARKLGTRIGRKMASVAVTGTGTGEPQGVLQGITGQEMGATGGPDYGDLVDLVLSLDEAYWENAKLYMNRSSFGTVVQIEDGANQLIFKQGSMVGNGSPVPSLWIAGQLVPVVLDSAIGNIVGTNGADDNWGIFGNLFEGYIWRMVRDIEILVNPYTSANKRQIEYNAWARADGRQKNLSAYKVIAGFTA